MTINRQEVKWYTRKFEMKMQGSPASTGKDWVQGSGCNQATCDAIWNNVKDLCIADR